MAGDDFKQRRSGDGWRPTARAVNGMQKAAQAVQDTDGGAGWPNTFVRQADVIRVRNDTGGALSAFDVVALDEPVINPDDNENAFANPLNKFVHGTRAPDEDLDYGAFVVLLDSIPDGKIGRAVASGIVPVKVGINDALHDFADIFDGETEKLVSGWSGGARILWTGTVTQGVAWCLCKIGLFSNAIGFAEITSTSPLEGDVFRSHDANLVLADMELNASGSQNLLVGDIVPVYNDFQGALGGEEWRTHMLPGYVVPAQATADYNTTVDPPTVACALGGNWNGVPALSVPTITVTLPYATGSYPNVREGDVVGVMRGVSANEWVAVSGHLDDGLGFAKIWPLNDAVPDGWEVLTDTYGRVVVGWSGSGDYGSIGGTGGFKKHGPTENNHDVHALSHCHGITQGQMSGLYTWNTVAVDNDGGGSTVTVVCNLAENGAWTGFTANEALESAAHTETDNRPPYIIYKFIKRVV